MGIRSLIVVVLAVAVVGLNAMPIDDDDDFNNTMIGGQWLKVSVRVSTYESRSGLYLHAGLARVSIQSLKILLVFLALR